MITRLIDIVFPADTNHHGTLFAGAGLLKMEQAALIAASRHGRTRFAVKSSERIDFLAPAYAGEIIELTARVIKIRPRSLIVVADLFAEALLSGERRHCIRGKFNVAVQTGRSDASTALPAIEMLEDPDSGTLHHSFSGGDPLAAMSKAAFVAATRRCRKTMVIASVRHLEFASHIDAGEIMDVEAEVRKLGNKSVTVEVKAWAENLLSGKRRSSGQGEFVLVAMDGRHKPGPIQP